MKITGGQHGIFACALGINADSGGLSGDCSHLLSFARTVSADLIRTKVVHFARKRIGASPSSQPRATLY